MVVKEEESAVTIMARPSPELSKEEASLKKLSYEMLVDLTAGSVGGVACVYAGQPFDTVKVKMQVSSHIYKSTMQCLKDMISKDGFRSFYAGTTPALVANVGENAVLFLCYGQCQKLIQFLCGSHGRKPNALQQACAGSLASVFSSFVLCPLELIKCRLQTFRELNASKTAISPMNVVRDVMRQDGLSGFYRGFVGTLAREVPGYFFFFGGYEVAKYILTPENQTDDSLSLWRTVVAGGVGGVSLWATVYPADVLKSRSQVQTGTPLAFVPLFRTILKEEGPRAFYRGVGPCLIRAVPANAALFLAYEWTKTSLS